MKHKRTMAWSAAAAVFCALLVGYFALSSADQVAGPHPHDKANHHPRPGDGSSN
jgi:Spy/CpxP family protein refolding chaperone